MRASTAYFAGLGTVILAIVGGVGGGLMMADIVSPKSPKQGAEMTRLEQRTSPRPIPAAATPLEPVPYLAAPQPSAPATTVATAPAQPQPQPQTEPANAAPAPAQRADASAAAPVESPAPQPAAQPPVAQQQAAVPGDALAKVRDADIKRAEDRRRAEQQRRQQWADKRRQRQQQELREVEEKVREDTESRQAYTSEPVRMELPQIRLFGPE
jgi:type IV secretory pathway VirB10-like protein